MLTASIHPPFNRNLPQIVIWKMPRPHLRLLPQAQTSQPQARTRVAHPVSKETRELASLNVVTNARARDNAVRNRPSQLLSTVDPIFLPNHTHFAALPQFSSPWLFVVPLFPVHLPTCGVLRICKWPDSDKYIYMESGSNSVFMVRQAHMCTWSLAS